MILILNVILQHQQQVRLQLLGDCMKYRGDDKVNVENNGEILNILQQLEFEATALHTAGLGAKGRGKEGTDSKLDREYHNTYCGMGHSASHSANHCASHNANHNASYNANHNQSQNASYNNNYSDKASRSISRGSVTRVSFNDEAPLREGRRRSISPSRSRSRSPSSEPRMNISRPHPSLSSSSTPSIIRSNSTTPCTSTQSNSTNRSNTPYATTPSYNAPSSPEDEVQGRYLSLLRQMGGDSQDKSRIGGKSIDKGDKGIIIIIIYYYHYYHHFFIIITIIIIIIIFSYGLLYLSFSFYSLVLIALYIASFCLFSFCKI